MITQEEPMSVGSQPDQAKTKQWPSAKLGAQSALLGQQPSQVLLLGRRLKRAEVDYPPGERRLGQDDLDWSAQTFVVEAGAQARMATQQRLCSGLERLRIQRAFQTEHQLHRVEVRCLDIVEGMEQ